MAYTNPYNNVDSGRSAWPRLMRLGREAVTTSIEARPDQLECRLSCVLTLSFVLLSALLARPIFTGGVYTYDDLGELQLPIRYLYSQALAAGDNFLWAPQLSNGYYLHGEGWVAMYHPLHWLLYRSLPLALAFNLEIILSYLWMFPGMYLMLRRLDLPQHASLMGGVLFTFSGFNLLHFVHPNEIAVISHIPWLIVAIDTVLRSSDRKKVAAAQLGVSLLTGSQLLLGQPQYVWFSALAEGLFVAWRMRQSITWWRIPILGLATVIGAMLGAVQMIPTLDVLSRSVRIDPSLDFRLVFSLHPINLVQLWSPFFFEGRTLGTYKQESVLYSGIFCSLGLVWLFVRRHSLGRWRSLVLSTSSLAAVMLVCSLGKFGGVYPWIARLPVIGIFRGPARYIVLVHFAMAILSAVAFADLAGLIRLRERLPWRALWPFAGFATLSVVTTIGVAWVQSRHMDYYWTKYLAPVTHSTSGMVLTLIATALVVAAARGMRWSLYAIIALIVIDITAWGVLWIWRVPPRPLETIASDHMKPPSDPTAGRIYSPWNSANVLTMKGYRLSHGYFTFLPAKKLDPKGMTAQRLAGVRWALNTKGFEYPNGAWSAVPDPMPRARLVSHAVVSGSVATNVERINIARTVLLDEPIDLPASEVGKAQIVTDRPGHVEVFTSSPSRQVLILSESYHPGWQATEDGRPIKILRAYGDFQACVVDPGHRRIVFRFRPASFVMGAWISILGTCLAAIVFLFGLLPRPNRSSGALVTAV